MNAQRQTITVMTPWTDSIQIHISQSFSFKFDNIVIIILIVLCIRLFVFFLWRFSWLWMTSTLLSILIFCLSQLSRKCSCYYPYVHYDAGNCGDWKNENKNKNNEDSNNCAFDDVKDIEVDRMKLLLSNDNISVSFFEGKRWNTVAFQCLSIADHLFYQCKNTLLLKGT